MVVALAIMAYDNFVPLLKNFIADVLKCKARLKTKFICLCVTVCSLVISSYSHDCINENIPNKVSAMF